MTPKSIVSHNDRLKEFWGIDHVKRCLIWILVKYLFNGP